MPTPSQREMLDAQYALQVHNHTALYGRWQGWRMAGRDLVSPDGVRFSPERMRGLAWRQESEQHLSNARARNAKQKAVRQGSTVKVVIVDLAHWQAQHLGRSAG